MDSGLRGRSVALVLWWGAATAGAAEIWATSGLSIIKFDSADPAHPTLVGQTGLSHSVDGLDFGPGGVLYAYSLAAEGGLYRINQSTGAATFIGTGGLVSGDVMLDISWDPVSNRMHGTGARDPSTPVDLYTINLATGWATLVGATDVPHPSTVAGLATNAAGTRYMHDGSRGGMYRLTGLNATWLGPEGPSLQIFEGMTIDWSRDGAWYHGGYNTGGTQRVELWRVNESTGAGTFIGNIGDPNQYLIGDLAIMPVPEPASVVLLAGLLTVLRRR